MGAGDRQKRETKKKERKEKKEHLEEDVAKFFSLLPRVDGWLGLPDFYGLENSQRRNVSFAPQNLRGEG